MPQADFFYSSDLGLDAASWLAEVESIIAGHDSSAGECKGRAFSVEVTHHRQVLLQVALLEKPHRDAAFMSGLQRKLADALASGVPSPCVIAVEVRFQSPFNESRRI